MTDFSEPLRVSDEKFESALTKLEDALRGGGAALLVDPRGRREIAIFEPTGWGIEPDEYRILLWVDQLLFLAFEPLTESDVVEWATKFDPALADVARARVTRLREFSLLKEIWEAKSHSILPIPMGVEHRIARDTKTGGVQVTLRLSSKTPWQSPTADPELKAENMTLQLLPSDVSFLRAYFASLEDEIAADESVEKN